MAKVKEMIGKILKPSKKDKEDKILLSKFDRMWSESESDRKNWDYKWYLYDLWVKGYHYARYDTRTKQVISKPVNDGRPKVVVNKIYPTLRSVRNYVLRNQPKAQVTPENLSEDTLDQANMATKFLNYIHETEGLRQKLKGTVWQALEFSIGWWQVIWNGEKIEVNPIDTFDLYWDSKARNPKEARYACIAVRRRIKDLLEDEKYDKNEVEEIKADNKLASSSYKEMLLAYDSPQKGQMGSGEDNGTTIVKEFWYKDEGKIYVAAVAGGRVIRRPEEVDTPILPFFRLSADVIPFSMCGEGWVKNLIDPQKLLNSGMSSIAEYNLVMNKVKVIADKGAGVRIIRNEHGEIIEKKRGYNLTIQSPGVMSEAIFRQVDLADSFIEDIGAMHDASRGRVPTGAKSGRAIEALQVGDSNNLSEVVENIEDFLEDVYEYILWLASQKYQDMQKVIINDYTGARQFLNVVGSSSPVAESMGENIPENTLVITDKNIVDVKISSYLAYTPEAKRESVKELISILPDLPEDVILDAYGVGNIADVIKGIREKRERDRQEQIAAETDKASQMNQVNNPQNGGQEAFAAIRTILSGQAPQVPNNPGPEYIQVFDDQIAKAKQAGDVSPEQLSAMQTFRDQVAQGVGRV